MHYQESLKIILQLGSSPNQSSSWSASSFSSCDLCSIKMLHCQRTFPTQLKSAIVIPLLKKPGCDQNVMKHYRPVSNLSFISKVIERVVASRLLDHMVMNDLLDPFQSAYRKDPTLRLPSFMSIMKLSVLWTKAMVCVSFFWTCRLLSTLWTTRSCAPSSRTSLVLKVLLWASSNLISLVGHSAFLWKELWVSLVNSCLVCLRALYKAP